MDKKRALELKKIMIEQGKIPTQLFKHTSISDNLYKTLMNAELWFASPTTFNDPFDCQINDQTNWDEENIRDYVNRTSQPAPYGVDVEEVVRKSQEEPGSFNKFFTDNLKKILSKQGVTCFLQSPDNLLLWAHYSDSHKGVCLKFDITEDDELFDIVVPVKYSKNYPNFDYLTERQQLVTKAMQTKSIHWEYEKEIRAFKPKFGNHPFKKECLKEIIFGCKADPDEIEKIRRIVIDANYPSLKLRQVKLKNYEYDIEIVDI